MSCHVCVCVCVCVWLRGGSSLVSVAVLCFISPAELSSGTRCENEQVLCLPTRRLAFALRRPLGVFLSLSHLLFVSLFCFPVVFRVLACWSPRGFGARSYNWGVCGLTTRRFECDDYPNDDSRKTTHQIYVSFTNPEQIEAIRVK
jgi:hypothetical protein